MPQYQCKLCTQSGYSDTFPQTHLCPSLVAQAKQAEPLVPFDPQPIDTGKSMDSPVVKVTKSG